MSKTPTPASGTRRAVSVKTAFIGQTGIAYPNENPIYGDGTRQKCHVVSGYTGSAKSLKRLAEIAAMDYHQLAEELGRHMRDSAFKGGALEHKIGTPVGPGYIQFGYYCLKALGLSPKNSKKAGRKL